MKTDYSKWKTEDILEEIEMYEKHYKEFRNFKIREILICLREELRNRKLG